MFLVTLLSIPESSFSAAFKMFDKDNDGSVLMLPSFNELPIIFYRPYMLLV